MLLSISYAHAQFPPILPTQAPLTETAPATDSVIEVPDLTGLNAPQAAAALNTAGLTLGTTAAITAAEGEPPGTIAAQNPQPFTKAAPGSAIEVLIAHAPNIRLTYDNNDMTLIYLGPEPSLALSPLQFQAVGDPNIRFMGSRWGGRVRASDCVQVWATRRREPKAVDGCRVIEGWLTTTDATQHVWTQRAGVEEFIVRQNGVEQARCPAAPRGSRNAPLVCEFFIGDEANAPYWPYLYLAYTTDTLIARNVSDDGWMRLNANITPAFGNTLTLNNPTLYAAVDRLLLTENSNGRPVMRALAPNQCVRFRTPDAPATAFPQPCLLFAEAIMDDEPFWTDEFSVEDRDGRDYLCPPARGQNVVICQISQ